VSGGRGCWQHFWK